MKTDRDNNGENFESTDEIDEENKGEIEEIETEVGAEIQVIRPHVPIPNYSSYDDKMRLESVDTVSYEDNLRIETVKELEETNIQIQIIRPHVPIDGDKNERNDDIDVENNGENYETDEIDEENKVEEIEIELGAKSQVIRPHVPIPNYSFYDNKTGRESREIADKSTQDNKSIASDNDATKEFMNEFSTGEQYVIKMLEIEGKNPERDSVSTVTERQGDLAECSSAR